MADLFREAPFGQIVRLISKNRIFRYPEEDPDFQGLDYYRAGPKSQSVGGPEKAAQGENGPDAAATRPNNARQHSTTLSSSEESIKEREHQPSLALQRTMSAPYSHERFDVERNLEIEKTKSRPILPSITNDGTVLVDWYNTDDPANPQNWSQKKKFFVAFQIDLYTFVVYAGSAIYVSSELAVMQRFGIAHFKAALGLAMYVLGYGLGPLLFSPMSELPAFGRNVPYVATFAIYIILCVPTSLVTNYGGFVFLRFLLGFFGSPCLATGGASMGDMYSLLYLPYSVALWVSAAFAAPALGPLLSGFSVPAENWRWSSWEILWMSAPVFILWFFCLPETSSPNILYRRAARLRKTVGAENIRSQTEIDRRGLTAKDIAFDAVIKPIEIMMKDPAVLFTNVYTALTYGIYYSFFEAFPLVYPIKYGFNLGETTVVFTCIVVGCIIAISIYFSYLQFLLIPDIMKNGLRAQEWRLSPALIFTFGLPIGLFLFAWTANQHVHWIASVIGITIFACTVYIVLQCIFVYIPMSYPPYAASLFASNDLCRSLFAFGSILYAKPMFDNLGIGKGVSLLAGLSVLGVVSYLFPRLD
ncbi:MAG: hypothetical protein M1836_006856 [Candelina mexicana]|nr:MAG: hypothetical protein M1836_006856 [Candelina mexicana]